MDNKLKFQQLECYKLATDEQKEKLNKEQYFDLDKLPGNQLQTEFVEYIYYRGTQVSILTIKRERYYFNSLCEFFQKSSHQENSLLDREKDFWIKQLKMWMIQNGRALTKHKVTNIQTESVEKAALIRYFESLLEFTLDRSETNELVKDIWHLERLAKELLDELKKLVESAEQEEEKNTIEVNQEQGDTSSESIKQWYDFNKIKREICCDKYIAEKVKFIYDKDDYYCIPGLIRTWKIGFLTSVFFNIEVLLKYIHHLLYKSNC